MRSSTSRRSVWSVAREQHEVITHAELIALGYSAKAIQHRIERGRLHPIHRGVYAVGRRGVTREGRWMAAALACGEGAALSHDSAAELWRLTKRVPWYADGSAAIAESGPVHVSVLSQRRSRDGIVAHRRSELNATTKDGIRVTTPAQTLIDLAPIWPQPQVEQAIGEATLGGLVTLQSLRTAASKAGRPGAPLRNVIERLTFRVTQSELERELLRLIAKAGLPLPETQTRFGRYRVDFYWPAIGLVVETDGGRFHATARQQAQDRRRDQAHIRAGRIPLRITHWQVFRASAETTALLADVFTACECRPRSASTKRAA